MSNTMQEIIKNENQFCTEIDCEKNGHNLFIYDSSNKKSTINLPYVLLEYKQWLIEKGIVQEVK